MNLTYSESSSRSRLSGQLWARSGRSGQSVAGLFLFGLPFLCGGALVSLVGLKIIHVNPRTVHAPYPVITLAGLLFYAAGLSLWFTAYKQYRASCVRAHTLGKNPADVARADYRWDEKGCDAQRWRLAMKTFSAAAGVTIFLSIFNWWAFFTKSDLGIKLIVGALDLAFSTFWIFFFFALGRAIKFGPSRIDYTRFPFYTGEPVILRWLTPTGINRADSGMFQLRCVEQRYETIKNGNESSAALVQEVHWSAEWSLSKPEDFPAGKSIELTFQPPADALATNLNPKARIIYWELYVELKEPGLDFKQAYLVPVYSRTANAGATVTA